MLNLKSEKKPNGNAAGGEVSDDVIVEVWRHEEIVFEVVVHGELTDSYEAGSSTNNGSSIHELHRPLVPHDTPQPVPRVSVAANDVTSVS